MHPYIQELLVRMKDDSRRPDEEDDGIYTNSKTVSYAAYYEASARVNEEHLPGLIEFYQENPEHADLPNILYIIEIIAGKTKNKSTTDFLFNLFLKSRGSTLNTLSNFFSVHYEELEDQYPVANFTKEDNHPVSSTRTNIYTIISKSKRFKNKKAYFIKLLESTDNPGKQREFLEFLGAYAEMDLLPLYKKYSTSKSIYVRMASKCVMISIYLRSGMNFEEIRKEMDLTHTEISELLRGEGTSEEKFTKFSEEIKCIWKKDNE